MKIASLCLKFLGLTLVLSMFLLVMYANNNDSTTSVKVVVTDRSDAVVPNATVTLTPKRCRCSDCNMNAPCPLCCASQREATDRDGIAQFMNVRIREYVVEVEVSGFKSSSTEVTPNVGAATIVNVRLGTSTAQVTEKCDFVCRIKKLFHIIF